MRYVGICRLRVYSSHYIIRVGTFGFGIYLNIA